MTKYKFNARYLDDMLRVSWDTAFTYIAKAMLIIAERYSGEAGARRLREQGYPPEMIEMTKGSGVRCFKFRAGMPILGVIGKMGITRMNGGCGALLDTYIRKVKPHQAQGGRYWSNYTWHGDQNPAHPFWSGCANLRYRHERHAVLQVEHQLGEKLRGKQDARSPLEAWRALSGAPGWW